MNELSGAELLHYVRVVRRDVVPLLRIDRDVVQLSPVDEAPSLGHNGALSPFFGIGDALRVGGDDAILPWVPLAVQERYEAPAVEGALLGHVNAAELE